MIASLNEMKFNPKSFTDVSELVPSNKKHDMNPSGAKRVKRDVKQTHHIQNELNIKYFSHRRTEEMAREIK